MVAEILEPKPNQLSPEATNNWYQYLEDCERGAERARRVLGIGRIAVEKGLDNGQS